MTAIVALCSQCGKMLGKKTNAEYLRPSELASAVADYRHEPHEHKKK